MVNRPMLWAAENPRLQRRIHNSKLLYGVRRDLQESLAKERYRVRVYILYGSAWYSYLMRRMAEKPTNLLFFMGSLIGQGDPNLDSSPQRRRHGCCDERPAAG